MQDEHDDAMRFIAHRGTEGTEEGDAKLKAESGNWK